MIFWALKVFQREKLFNSLPNCFYDSRDSELMPYWRTPIFRRASIVKVGRFSDSKNSYSFVWRPISDACLVRIDRLDPDQIHTICFVAVPTDNQAQIGVRICVWRSSWFSAGMLCSARVWSDADQILKCSKVPKKKSATKIILFASKCLRLSESLTVWSCDSFLDWPSVWLRRGVNNWIRRVFG